MMSYVDKAGLRTITIEGPIGETTDFFLLPFAGIKEMHLNFEKATYMNSVGVKHWVEWAAKIPIDVKVNLKKCPSYIANQSSTVVGFLPKKFHIESFYVHYVCPNCNLETSYELKESTHFKRTDSQIASWYKLPDLNCSKCLSEKLEPDFIPEKIFGFLK